MLGVVQLISRPHAEHKSKEKNIFSNTPYIAMYSSEVATSTFNFHCKVKKGAGKGRKVEGEEREGAGPNYKEKVANKDRV